MGARVKRRGHPSLVDGETSTPVNVRLPDAQFDRADAKRKRDRVSMPTLLRRALTQLLDDEEDDDD
jgi:Ribbon-helix-helix protein, copG family